jgi:hypothetical protein
MGWGSGINEQGREVGYLVDAECDFPGCGARINRGLSYVCGDMHDGGNHGCGGYFCERHLESTSVGRLCGKCAEDAPPYDDEKDE